MHRAGSSDPSGPPVLEVDFPFSSAKLRWRLEAHNLIEIEQGDSKEMRLLVSTSTYSAVMQK